MSKEIILDHKDISNSQTITPVVDKKFKEQGLDIHHHEVEDIDDDFSKGKRRLRIKNTIYSVPSMRFKNNYDNISWE
jgi:hypothetical protein